MSEAMQKTSGAFLSFGCPLLEKRGEDENFFKAAGRAFQELNTKCKYVTVRGVVETFI